MADPIEIIRGNLNVLEEELISLQERRLAHLEERFRAVMEEIGDDSEMDWDEYMDIVRGICWEYFPQHTFNHERCLPENRRAVRELLGQNYVMDSIAFSRALARQFREEFSPVQALTARQGRQPNRIAYLRSAFSDLAYRRFSEVLEEPTVAYCDDFNAVCQDVYDGRASLCILPLENSNEGRLTSFRNLINKYDLKLVMTCTVMTGENGALTRFGLLKRNMEMIPLRRNVPHRELFEFFYTLPDEGMSIEGKLADLSDILLAARSMRMDLQKIDSEPVTTADAEYGYYLTFYTDAANAELSAFLFYLMMDAPQFAPIGFYTHLL